MHDRHVELHHLGLETVSCEALGEPTLTEQHLFQPSSRILLSRRHLP